MKNPKERIKEPKAPVYQHVSVKFDTNRATVDDIHKALEDVPGVEIE